MENYEKQKNGADPNDRAYGRGLEKIIKRMKPKNLGLFIEDVESEDVVSYDENTLGETMQFELRYLDNYLIISDFIYNAEDAINGNPYNTTFNLQVQSGAFSGVAACEYDIKEFCRFANEINELYTFQRSKTELKDICYGSSVSFHMDKTGHLIINGEIYGDAMIHSLKFEYLADQTSLKSFVYSLAPFDRK